MKVIARRGNTAAALVAEDLARQSAGQMVAGSTARGYDLSGNVVHGYRWVGKRRGDGTITLGQEEETRS